MVSSWDADCLRFAQPSDADELAPLNFQLIRDEGHRNPMTVPQLAVRMRGWLETDYRALVQVDKGKIIAYALYRESEQEIYLRHLFVCVDFRRRGIGRTMMNYLIHTVWPKEKRLTVEVLVNNLPALAFWRSIGYHDYSLELEILPHQGKLPGS
jgi:ribosomal protein S18 acetylase RimI-like enzyme